MKNLDFEFDIIDKISINPYCKFDEENDCVETLSYKCSFYAGDMKIEFSAETIEDVIDKLLTWDNFFDSDYYYENFDKS